MASDDFTVKDTGEREDYASGMKRDTEAGKTDYTLALDGPMFKRYAEHLTKGAVKYGPRNWQLADSQAEYERFRRSAFRHFIQWLDGDRDEDHAAAIWFNVNAAEYVRDQLVKDQLASLEDSVNGLVESTVAHYLPDMYGLWFGPAKRTLGDDDEES